MYQYSTRGLSSSKRTHGPRSRIIKGASDEVTKVLALATSEVGIGITSRAWNADTIRDGLSGHLRGTQQPCASPPFSDRDTPLWQVSSVGERKNQHREISRYPSENSRNRECCNKPSDNIYRYAFPPGFTSKRRRFFARVQVTYMQVHDVFSSSSGFLSFFFFFVRLPDFRIILFVIVLINDASYSRYF